MVDLRFLIKIVSVLQDLSGLDISCESKKKQYSFHLILAFAILLFQHTRTSFSPSYPKNMNGSGDFFISSKPRRLLSCALRSVRTRLKIGRCKFNHIDIITLTFIINYKRLLTADVFKIGVISHCCKKQVFQCIRINPCSYLYTIK